MKETIKREEYSNRIKKEYFCKEILLIDEKCNHFLLPTTTRGDKDTYEFFQNFFSLLEIPEVSDEKLSQLEPSPLKNLLKQFENNTVNSIWSGLEKKIEIQDYRNYCQKNIPNNSNLSQKSNHFYREREEEIYAFKHFR